MTDTTAAPPITRESARAEMESIQTQFHALLDSLSPEEFKRKSGNGAWSNGQLMWHMAWGLSYIPNAVGRCRSGKSLNLPRGVFNALNPWITRWGSRGITPEKVAKMYDEANAKAMTVLDTVQDDEWSKGCSMAGTAVTIESEFRVPAVHFAEHHADILKSLGRSA